MNLLNSSVLGCGKPPCPEHGRLCAFHGDEPGHCPWCHCSWVVVFSRGFHSCETRAVWTNGKRPDNAEYVTGRIAEAAAMRKAAAEQIAGRPLAGWQAGHCSHGSSGTPEPCEAPATAQNAAQGGF